MFLVANFILFLIVKNVENWLKFDRVIADNNREVFLCYTEWKDSLIHKAVAARSLLSAVDCCDGWCRPM